MNVRNPHDCSDTVEGRSNPLHDVVVMTWDPSAALLAIGPVAHHQRRLPATGHLALIDRHSSS